MPVPKSRVSVLIEMVEDALHLHQGGQTEQAARMYAEVLAIDPSQADALHLLGLLKARSGDLEQGICFIERAITSKPDFSPYHNNLGNFLKQAGRIEDAEKSYLRAIEVDPKNADALLNLGKLLHDKNRLDAARELLIRSARLAPHQVETWMSIGRLEQFSCGQEAAISAFRRATEIQEFYAPAHLMLAESLCSAGLFAQGKVSLLRALEVDPGYGDAYFNLGNMERQQKKLPEAAAAYQKAIALSPATAADAYNNLGVTLSELGECNHAIAAYLQAIELRPAYDDAYVNLGREAGKAGSESVAERCLRKAIALNPKNWGAYHDLGSLQQKQGLLEEAIASFRKAAENPIPVPALLSNLAVALALQGDPEAFRYFEDIVRHEPGHADWEWNWSMALLLHGNYAAGWSKYEKRLQVEHLQHHYPAIDRPRWNGEPLEGKTILLRAEQGLGDTLQFARYVPLVSQRGGLVVLQVERSLQRLLAAVPGVMKCIPLDEFCAFDTYTSLMSLPFVFGTTIETVPSPVKLHPFTRPTADYRSQGTCRVGLVWGGNPKHAKDRLRSIPLHALAPLAGIEGVTYTSLQVGAAAQMRGPENAFTFVGDCSAVKNLADTAEIISNLDLVITIDSAVAHLAGSMGVPTWVLLARDLDWRWGLRGTETPWYPSVRLFRQKRPADWSPVIEEVTTCLLEEVGVSARETLSLSSGR